MKNWLPIAGLLPMIVLPAQASLSASEEFQLAQMAGGPLAGITVMVVDEKNDAVSGASVEAHFENIPEKDVRTGKTDAKGSCYCEGRSFGDVWFGIAKDGYYKTSQVYSFARNAPSWEKPTKPERWIPWNPAFTVTLKRIRNPAPMYAKYVEFMRIPLDQSVGFDFEVGDCVTPYGKGVISDVVFRVGRPKEKKSNRFPLGFSFSNPLDGMGIHQRDKWSEFVTSYEAPEVGYERIFEQVDQQFRDPNPFDTKQWYYVLRVRSVSGSDGRLSSARYAKMWAPVDAGCNGDKCLLTLYYWYNPDGTRNLEYDTKKNLFKNLRSEQQMIYP